MPLHDAYARLTPFEIAFPHADRLEALARAVHAEAATRSVDPAELDGFLGLAAVGDFLAEVHGDEVQETSTARVALLEYGTLAFHGVRFLEAGTPVFLLTTQVARGLVETPPAGTTAPPASAGYVQLPQHLFWTRVEDASPESVDGAFWTVSGAGRLHVLPVTGVRADRPGFGTLAVPDAPLAHAADWVHTTARPDGRDYASDLPGAGLDRLYEIRSVGEILKLMARFFAHVAEHPGRDGGPSGSVPPNGPRPSALPYTRIGVD